MYHLPGLWIFKTCNRKTYFPFSLFFTFSLWRKKKWNLQSSALDKLSAERCLLPRHYVPCHCAALFSSFYFIIFMLVFNVKLRKETNYNIIALWDEQDSSLTLDAYMTPDFYDRTEDLYLMAYLTLVCWRSYTILNYKVCFKIDIVDSSLFFVIELFFRGAVV